MSTRAQLVVDAADRTAGMTLGDIQRFVDQAFRNGFDVTDQVRAKVGFRAQLQQLTARPGPLRPDPGGDPP
ncbi:hypothetical protein G9U51_08385 [Calidifontibacter sp. DB0510]|uniref:Uncharacterized protein n=1 Tax=Metallococcus carri TaxID=1656884 RepID=A0A967AZZ5_9MICO|nr:hypothetical protein [Metallococcus carri]NHN55793.1 hypothetical protein [Metallococcus carri]NOP38518.1 hypothetical protein [Calidifontibacter sp. DB2511S]